MCEHHQTVMCIMPPHILRHLLESGNKKHRDVAMRTLAATVQLQTRRSLRGVRPGATIPGAKQRTIYDAQNEEVEGGILVRSEGGPPTGDAAADAAYDYLGIVHDYFDEVHERNSIDDHGMRLDGVVHFGEEYNNAFWNGTQMIFGDGDGTEFISFTKSLDVVAHELAHGVTEHSASLVYHKQPGALNESFSDVFGSLVKQWHNEEEAQDADWLIGADIFSPSISGDALRSLKDPGKAYDDPTLGKDPQPAHMRDYQDLPDNRWNDWGGVHINSGIPNHAFYRLATALGGAAWEDAGLIWYETLHRLTAHAQFNDCARTTLAVADEIFGPASDQQSAVRDAWDGVGVTVDFAARRSGKKGKQRKRRKADEALAGLKQDLQAASDLLRKAVARLS